MTSLNHVRGDTFSVLHTLQAPDQQARDLTGYQIIAVLEQRNGQAIATLELELLDQATLTGRFLLKSPDSSTWPLTRLRYKVRFIDPQGVVSTSGFIDVRVTLAHESDCCGSSDEPIQVSISHEIMIAETDPDQLQASIGTVLTGGGSQVLIVGNWDMRNISASVYQVTTGSVVENQQLSALPSVDLPRIDNLGPYVSATAELSTDISISAPALATDLFLFGLHDAASSVIEQVNQIMTGAMPSGLLMSLVSFGAGDYQINVFADSMTNVPSSAIKDGLLNMHINDGVLSIEGVDDFAYNVPNNSMFGVVSLVQGEGAPSTMSIITSGQSAPAILPSDWFNGAVYRVTDGGTYANKTTLAGDFVTVIDDGADLIVVHADKPIDVDVVALLADEQAARMAADEAERLARINADLSEQLARQSALSSLQTSMTAQLQTVANQIAASRAFFILKIVGVSYPNGESVSGADVYYLKQGDWYILNRKDGLVGGAERYQHVYQWNGNASGFVVVPEADVYALQNTYEVVFNVRNNLFFGSIYQDSDGWMYSINSALNNPAGDTNTYLHMLFSDPAKQVTSGYMSLEHVQRLQAVESLAQVNNLNLSDKADLVEVEGIAAQAETNRLALLTKADITALATLTTLVGTKADQSYVNDQIANLVGTDGQVLAAIQAIADELANAEGILEALDQTVANRVRFDVATQALTSLQKYNARTNIGAEEVGTAAMLVAQVTVASLGAATAAQGVKADSALQSGDVAPVALSGNYADLIGRPTLPTNTDGLNEGTSNQYFTSARVRAALMTGISFATATAVLATDGLLVAVGKLQAQLNNIVLDINNINLRGQDLVSNGLGQLKNNKYFSTFTFDPLDRPAGAGSFTGASGMTSGVGDELIPVDPTKYYKFSYYIRQKTVGLVANAYGFISPFDSDGYQISPWHYMARPSTLTTLALDLKAGDTVMQLTSAANWIVVAGSTQSHNRSAIFWNYVDGSGYLWPENTYSRNWSGADLYSDGGISGNTITLRVPWVGATIPAGTKLSNGSSGGNYMYMGIRGTATPEVWTNYSGVFGTTHESATLLAATTQLPISTAYIKVGFLFNRNPSGSAYLTGSKTGVGGLNLRDWSAVLDPSLAKTTLLATTDTSPTKLVTTNTNGDLKSINITVDANGFIKKA